MAPHNAASLARRTGSGVTRNSVRPRAQVIHPFLMRAKDAQRLAAEPVDDVVRQIAGAHVGDRRGIDHIGRRPAQQAAEESQARLAGPGAERGEAVGGW